LLSAKQELTVEFVWKIEGYDGSKKILEQTVPLNDANEAKITSILRALASKGLTPGEISAGNADVHKDDKYGNRIIFSAGENPYYVASLWRSDELRESTRERNPQRDIPK
jgi:hypothetical protein